MNILCLLGFHKYEIIECVEPLIVQEIGENGIVDVPIYDKMCFKCGKLVNTASKIRIKLEKDALEEAEFIAQLARNCGA